MGFSQSGLITYSAESGVRQVRHLIHVLTKSLSLQQGVVAALDASTHPKYRLLRQTVVVNRMRCIMSMR